MDCCAVLAMIIRFPLTLILSRSGERRLIRVLDSRFRGNDGRNSRRKRKAAGEKQPQPFEKEKYSS